MSKKPQKTRQRALALERDRFRRRLKRLGRNTQRKSLAKGQVPSDLSEAPRLIAPERFEVMNAASRTKLLQFLRSLRELTLKRQVRVTIDFERTTSMVACGTLLFLAEVKRIVAVGTARKSRLIRYRRIADAKVGQVLQQIGFFDAIGKKSKIQPTASDVVHWRAVSGSGADGRQASGLIEGLGDRLPASLSSPMYAGIIEAMTNSKQHAYIHKRRDGMGISGNGEWWMFAKEEDGRVTVAICDLGIGIPNSLPLTQESEGLRQLLAGIGRTIGVAYTDADLVQAAVRVGRSRTRASHRGKGLKDVIDVINAAGAGVIRIYSNRGCYLYQMTDSSPREEQKNYRHSILGTIIQWSVPIAAGVKT